MMPYVFLIGFLILFYGILRRTKGLSDRKPSVYSMTAAGVLTALLGLRHPSMGVDLGYGRSYGYLVSFHQITAMSWGEILKLESFQNYEKGYLLFNKLLGTFWESETFFLFSCAALSVLPIGAVIGKYSRNCRTSFLIYLGLPVFWICFSGLRQAIAVALTFWGFGFVRERKWKPYILTVAAASLFHSTAVVALLIYPLYWLCPGRTARYGALGVLLILFLLRGKLWNLIVQLTGRGTEAVSSGSVNLWLLFCGIYVYVLLFSKENGLYDGLISLLYMTCCILTFTEVSDTALRVAYYFMPHLTLLLPELLQDLRRTRGQREYILHFLAVAGGFLLFFLYNLKHTAWAGAYPYHGFWVRLYPRSGG